MKVKFLDLQAGYPSYKDEAVSKFQEIIERSAFVSGKYVEEFEKSFADYLGATYCVAVDNGTNALYLALMAYGIGRGDEVIIPANTFIATAEAVALLGAVPVFTDIDATTYNMLPEDIEARITPRTKAIVPVHMYGACAPMDEIFAIGKKHRLVVIEDACQAHGSGYKNLKAGTIGHTGVFSFYPGKNLGTWGEGGAVVTSDEHIADTVRLLRSHGSKVKYQHEILGGNFRMGEFQGAVLASKLPYLDAWNDSRRKNATLYRKLLGKNPRIILPSEHHDITPIWHLFVVRVRGREDFMHHLKDKEIETGIHYPVPLHLSPPFKYLGHKKGDFPVAESVAEEIVSLPMYPELTEEHITYVAETVNTFLH